MDDESLVTPSPVKTTGAAIAPEGTWSGRVVLGGEMVEPATARERQPAAGGRRKGSLADEGWTGASPLLTSEEDETEAPAAAGSATAGRGTPPSGVRAPGTGPAKGGITPSGAPRVGYLVIHRAVDSGPTPVDTEDKAVTVPGTGVVTEPETGPVDVGESLSASPSKFGSFRGPWHLTSDDGGVHSVRPGSVVRMGETFYTVIGAKGSQLVLRNRKSRQVLELEPGIATDGEPPAYSIPTGKPDTLRARARDAMADEEGTGEPAEPRTPRPAGAPPLPVPLGD